MLPEMEVKVKMQLENLFMDLEKDIETPSEEMKKGSATLSRPVIRQNMRFSLEMCWLER